MKILFLYHTYKEKHEWLLRGISEVFSRHNYSVDYEAQELDSYDCILVFNKIALKKYKNLLIKSQKPVIYMFCLSDIAEEYIVADFVNSTIAFKDKIINVNHLSLSAILFQDMIFPSCIPPKTNTLNEKPIIYIRIEDDYLCKLTFLKLLPLLNQIDNFVIHYQSNNLVSRDLINNHIKIIHEKKDFLEEIDRADIVIVSGMTATFAIQKEKKTIIIGERGYGGLVTEENLEYHLSNCFQGRNGGKLDEFIPLDLVKKAIDAEKSDAKKTMVQLSLIQKQREDKFIQRIENAVSIANRVTFNESSLFYRLNPDYDIIKKNKRFWLYKRVFCKMYKSISESESVVILAFKEAKTVKTALSQFPAEYEEDIREYIQELIDKKIIIPIENSTSTSNIQAENYPTFLMKGIKNINILKQIDSFSLKNVRGEWICNIEGIEFVINSAEELAILKEVFVEKVYKVDFNQHFVFIDIGMNVGITSLYFAKKSECKKVIAFEPLQPTLYFAKKNLERNKFFHKIQVNEFGLGYPSRIMDIDYLEEIKGCAGINNGTVPWYIDKKGLRKEQLHIIDVFEALNEIVDEKIILKIDCEGCEYEILERLNETGLLPRFDVLMIEWHYKGTASLRKILLDNNFKIRSTENQNLDSGMLYAFRNN